MTMEPTHNGANMATELAVMDHRIRVLEKIPPRIMTLEHEVAGIKSELHLARADISHVKDQCNDNHTLLAGMDHKVGELGEKIARLFWTGAGVFLTCSVIGGAIALIVTVIKSGIFG